MARASLRLDLVGVVGPARLHGFVESLEDAARFGARRPNAPTVRVLLVTRKFPPSVGGMQRMIADLAAALRAECELQVVKPRVHARSWTAAFFGSASARVAASALLHRHDVLLIGDAALAPLARVNRQMSRAPSVLLAYGLDLTYPSRPYQSWLRMGLAAVDLVVAVSASTGQIAVSKGVDRARVVVIPPGFHPRFAEPFPRDAARAVLRSAVPAIQASDLLLLGVGRLVAVGLGHRLLELNGC